MNRQMWITFPDVFKGNRSTWARHSCSIYKPSSKKEEMKKCKQELQIELAIMQWNISLTHNFTLFILSSMITLIFHILFCWGVMTNWNNLASYKTMQNNGIDNMMQHVPALHLQVSFVFIVFSVGRCGVRHMHNSVVINTCGLPDTLAVQKYTAVQKHTHLKQPEGWDT